MKFYSDIQSRGKVKQDVDITNKKYVDESIRSIVFAKSTMPSPSSEYLTKIVLYVGENTGAYMHFKTYVSEFVKIDPTTSQEVYKWVNSEVLINKIFINKVDYEEKLTTEERKDIRYTYHVIEDNPNKYETFRGGLHQIVNGEVNFDELTEAQKEEITGFSPIVKEADTNNEYSYKLDIQTKKEDLPENHIITKEMLSSHWFVGSLIPDEKANNSEELYKNQVIVVPNSKINDFYLNDITNSIYKRTDALGVENTWERVSNISGADLYETAKKNGYTGTFEEFIEMIKGTFVSERVWEKPRLNDETTKVNTTYYYKVDSSFGKGDAWGYEVDLSSFENDIPTGKYSFFNGSNYWNIVSEISIPVESQRENYRFYLLFNERTMIARAHMVNKTTGEDIALGVDTIVTSSEEVPEEYTLLEFDLVSCGKWQTTIYVSSNNLKSNAKEVTMSGVSDNTFVAGYPKVKGTVMYFKFNNGAEAYCDLFDSTTSPLFVGDTTYRMSLDKDELWKQKEFLFWDKTLHLMLLHKPNCKFLQFEGQMVATNPIGYNAYDDELNGISLVIKDMNDELIDKLSIPLLSGVYEYDYNFTYDNTKKYSLEYVTTSSSSISVRSGHELNFDSEGKCSVVIDLKDVTDVEKIKATYLICFNGAEHIEYTKPSCSEWIDGTIWHGYEAIYKWNREYGYWKIVLNNWDFIFDFSVPIPFGNIKVSSLDFEGGFILSATSLTEDNGELVTTVINDGSTGGSSKKSVFVSTGTSFAITPVINEGVKYSISILQEISGDVFSCSFVKFGSKFYANAVSRHHQRNNYFKLMTVNRNEIKTLFENGDTVYDTNLKLELVYRDGCFSQKVEGETATFPSDTSEEFKSSVTGITYAWNESKSYWCVKDGNVVWQLFNALHPVGQTILASTPPTLGTWEEIASNTERALMIGSNKTFGDTIGQALPKPSISCGTNGSHSHSYGRISATYSRVKKDADTNWGYTGQWDTGTTGTAGSHSHSVTVATSGAYGTGSKVLMDGYFVKLWKRTE